MPIIRDVLGDKHLAAFQTAVRECTVLNIIREDKEAGQATYQPQRQARDRDSFILNATSGDVRTAQTGRQGAVVSWIRQEVQKSITLCRQMPDGLKSPGSVRIRNGQPA